MKLRNYLNEITDDEVLSKELSKTIRERGEGNVELYGYKIKSYNSTKGFTFKYLNNDHITDLLLRICKKENLSCSTKKIADYTLFFIEMKKPV